MVESNKEYEIRPSKLGSLNWTGFKSLWAKECNRFSTVWQQTLLSPIVSSLLFLSVLSLALGNDKADVLGHSFISFLAPGLIAMSILTQSFSHSVSSLMISKIQGNIVDMLYAPLSALEVTMAIVLAALTRSFLIAIISIGVFSLIVGFLGESDGSISIGLIYLIILSIIMWYVAFYLYKKGYKIKS